MTDILDTYIQQYSSISRHDLKDATWSYLFASALLLFVIRFIGEF